MDAIQTIAFIAVFISLPLIMVAFFYAMNQADSRKTNKNTPTYEFNLKMYDNDYYAYIWEDNSRTNRIAASKVFDTEQEALDFLDERAKFLQVEEYKLIRKIG